MLLLAAQLAWSLAPALGTIRNDFANYYVPARAVMEGRRLDRVYERAWFQVQAEDAGLPALGSFVPQPPVDALLLLPVAWLPPLAAKAAWTLALAAAMVAAFLVLRPLVALPPAALALVFLLPAASLRNALLYGQPYPLLLLCLCLSLRAAARDRPLAAGLWLAPVLALKLYGLPFVLWFAWRRWWRALAGALAGAAVIATLSVCMLGREVHGAYLREVLPASLAGRIQDPYSPIWQSATSLSYRLFQYERDLNPHPVADHPALARALAAALPAAAVLGAIAALGPAASAARAWAALTIVSLAASPLTSSYHFLMLILPAALLVADPARAWTSRAAVALLFLFSTSPFPHYFAWLASGWGDLLAYPRLFAVLAMLAVAVGRPASWRPIALGLAAAGALGASAAARTPAEESWAPVEVARGYLLADPQACPGGLSWLTVEDDRLARRGSGARCPARVRPAAAEGAVASAWETGDADSAAGVAVFVDPRGDLRERSGRVERILLHGPARHPRLSPEGAWVACQLWRGSWDLWAVERASGRALALTRDAAGELEPAWEADGRGLVFASDRRRGLGSTALYRVGFAPGDAAPAGR